MRYNRHTHAHGHAHAPVRNDRRAVTAVAMTLRCALWIAFCIPVVGHAQSIVASKDSAAATDSTDAPESYTHYSVRQCAEALTRRARVPLEGQDTTRWTPSMATAREDIRDAAQRCREAGRWTVTSVDLREVLPLFQLDVALSDTADGNAIMKRSLAAVHTPEEQAARLVKFHDLQLRYLPFNRPWLDETIVRMKRIPGTAGANAVGEAIQNMILISGMYHALDYATTLQYLDDAAKIAPAMDSAHRSNMVALKNYVAVSHWAEVDSILVKGAPVPVPPFNGRVILGALGPYPVPNKITVIISATGMVTSSIAARRIAARFGDTVAVVLVGKTAGFVNWDPQLKFADEARRVSRYYADTLRGTGALLWEETPFHFRPAPDGRRVYESTPNDELFKTFTPPEFAKLIPPFAGFAWMVVNTSGQLQNAGMSVDGYSELQIDQSIGRAIRRTVKGH